MYFPLLLPLATALLAASAPASEPLQKRQAGQLITRCTVPNTVGMSFDDGPYIYAYDIVGSLLENNSTATFFYSGDNWDCIYNTDAAARVKFAYDSGMHVASHTWRHADLASLTWDQIHDEMWRVEQALMRITGAYPAFMRPPYGSYNGLVLEAARVRGQAVITWDFDSGDSGGATAQQSIDRYIQTINQHPSTILPLNHETYASTAFQVIPAVLPRLRAAGYRVVSVAECLGLPRYQWTGSPSPRDSSWHC